MKIYKASRRGVFSYLIVGLILVTISIYFFDQETFGREIILLLPLIFAIFLLVWIYFDTSYRIEAGKLFYRSGFLRNSIAIHDMDKIIKGTTMWTGSKPALAENGLIIKYNKFDEIYLAPENNEELIAGLLKINPKIKVVDGD